VQSPFSADLRKKCDSDYIDIIIVTTTTSSSCLRAPHGNWNAITDQPWGEMVTRGAHDDLD
jgi:hypothetical protein